MYLYIHLLLLLLLLCTLLKFFTSALADGFFTGVWVTVSLLKSPGLFSVFNNDVVWMVSTRPSTSRPFNNLLVTVPKAPITIGTIVTFMFNSFFFNSLARSSYLSFFSPSFRFILLSAGTAKSTILHFFFFFFFWFIRSGLLAEIRWSVCMSKPHRSLCVIF